MIERLGRYEVCERLGEGRTAIVYRARCEGREGDVALKVLKDEAQEQEGLRQRFLNEGRVLRGLGSPYIVEIYELVFDEQQDQAYIAMELLRGKTLGQLVREQGVLSEAVVARVGLQLARALVAVHGAGLIYRDLKPDNVFLLEGEDAASPRIKLLDFGTVKPLGVDADLGTTDPGTAVGTPYYMSPEQITDQAVDARSDLYSFGALLFELLTGRVPFVAKSYGELMLQLVTDLPPRIETLRGDPVSAQMDGLVRRCLEKEPIDRHSSAMELAAVLDAIVDPVSPLCPKISGEIHVTPEPSVEPSKGLRDVGTAQLSVPSGGDARKTDPLPRWALPLALLALFGGAAVVLSLLHGAPQPPAHEEGARHVLTPGPDALSPRVDGAALAIPPRDAGARARARLDLGSRASRLSKKGARSSPTAKRAPRRRVAAVVAVPKGDAGAPKSRSKRKDASSGVARPDTKVAPKTKGEPKPKAGWVLDPFAK